jgi:hypothetical protein
MTDGRRGAANWAIVALGLWTLLAPLTLAYGVGEAPHDARTTGPTLAARVVLMNCSDLACGAALMIAGWRAHYSRRFYAAMGLWLSFAPLLSFAPSELAATNATLVGVLLIAISALLPGAPRMSVLVHVLQPKKRRNSKWEKAQPKSKELRAKSARRSPVRSVCSRRSRANTPRSPR